MSMVGGHRLPQRDGQLAKWRDAIAQSKRQQRQRRGKRVREQLLTYQGPGMVRVNPPKPKEQP
jgi:hypothetical protein